MMLSKTASISLATRLLRVCDRHRHSGGEGVAVVKAGDAQHLDEHLDHVFSEEGMNPPDVVQEKKCSPILDLPGQ